MKKTVTTILLLILLAGLAAGALTLYSWTAELRDFHQARVNVVRQQLDSARTAYALIDPSTDEGAAKLLETENAAVAEAQAQTEQLLDENAALETEIESLQRQADELAAEEETAYYLEIYDQMVKGIEEVQGYIEGN